jgi:hypothetical protein
MHRAQEHGSFTRLLPHRVRCAAAPPAAAPRLHRPLTRPAQRAQALALRTGLLNLQVAALQIAACNAGMKTVTKRNLHAAMAINNFRHAKRPARSAIYRGRTDARRANSSAGLAAYNHQVNGLGGAEANMRMAVTVGLGVLAAAQAVQENSSL